MDVTIDGWAVLLAAGATFLIGGLWYSVLFARPWQRATGVSEGAQRSGVARVFLGSFVLALVMATGLAAFIGREGVAFGAAAGAAAGVLWVAAALGVNDLFERRPLRLWAINAGYHALSFTAMGAIVGGVQV